MNLPDTCDASGNKCGCGSQTCCKSSSADLLFASIQSGNIVCNLGTGNGFHIKKASENAGASGKVIIIAPVPSLLSSVQSEISLSGIQNAELRLGDVDALPIESTSVDIITGENSLTATKNRDAVLREFIRILRAEGRIVLYETVGICVAACLTDMLQFESIKTTLTKDLTGCLQSIGFSIESIDISIDKSISNPDEPDSTSAIALKAFIRATKK